jgi:hypothetical protein
MLLGFSGQVVELGVSGTPRVIFLGKTGDRIIWESGGRLYESEDGGLNSSQITVQVVGISQDAMWHLPNLTRLTEIPKSNGLLLAQAFASTNNNFLDVGGVWRSVNGGSIWFNTGLPIPNNSWQYSGFGFDLLSPSVVYTSIRKVGSGSGSGADIFPLPVVSIVYRSLDSGVSWSPLISVEDTSWEIDHSTIGSSIAAYGSKIFAGNRKSIDGGLTWGPLSRDDYINSFFIKNIFVSSPTGKLVLATTNGGVIRSTDGGDSWTAVSLGNDQTHDIAQDPYDAGVFYATGMAGRLYRSTDFGLTWDLYKEIPNDFGMEIADLYFDPSDDNLFISSSVSRTYFFPIDRSNDTLSPDIELYCDRNLFFRGDVAEVRFYLSEFSVDFSLADIEVIGGYVSYFSGDGREYLAGLVPNPLSTGEVTVRVSSGKFSDSFGNVNDDGNESNNTIELNFLPSGISGVVYHWKSHMLLAAVDVLVGGNEPTAVNPPPALLDLRSLAISEDRATGNRVLSVEVWANPRSGDANFDFQIFTAEALAASFTSSLGGTWTVITNAENPNTLTVGGFDAGAGLGTSAVKLGILELTYGPLTERAELLVSQINLGSTAGPPSSTLKISSH